MEFRGTPNDDDIDQRKLGLPEGTAIYGGDGKDRITVANGLAIGGRGDDTIIAAGDWSTVAYWDSPAGVRVDLGKGIASDGFGTQDTLVGVHTVQGTGFDDTLVGGAADEFFYGGAGSNTVDGGGGFDTVSYYFEKSLAAEVSYDAALDTFTVRKHFASGDSGVDRLTGIEKIAFSGEGSDGKVILRSQFVGDLRGGSTVAQVPSAPGAGVTQLKTGDFDGDGHMDLAYVTQVGTGTAPAPTWIFLGDGKGGFVESTRSVLGAVPMKIVGGGRSIVADFNGDGQTDLFQLDFGDDAPPFAGGMNSLYLSDGHGRLVDASGNLPRRLDTNHGGSAGDIDGDGDVDVLVNALGQGNVLLVNDGSGHFTENTSLLPRPSSRLGGVTYQETSTFSGIVDVNGDGAPDLILGTWDGAVPAYASKVLLNDGHGDFTKQAPIALPSSGIDREIVLEVEAIDLNGDAFPDLMLSITNGGDNVVFYHTDYIQLLVNDGTGHFRDETAIRLPQSRDSDSPGWLMSLSSVDFNHDGHADILAESAGAPISSRVYLNRGDGSFALDWESSEAERAVAADIDGDGMTDVVAAKGAGDITAWYNTLPNGHLYTANFGGDRLLGSNGNDIFRARPGADVFDGAGGFDVALFNGARASYAVSGSAGVVSVKGLGGVATLSHIERLAFADGALAFDTDGVAGQAYRIYQAAFGRAPDTGGLGFWIGAMDGGMKLEQVAAQFVASQEFSSRYGELAAGDFLATLYHNVLHREPDAAGFDFWIPKIDHGVSRAQLLALFSESAENQAQLIGSIAGGIAYLPFSA